MALTLALILVGPLVAGCGFAIFVRAHRWPYWWLLCTVPFVSTLLVAIVFFLFEIYFLITQPESRNAYPIYTQALGATVFFAFTIFFYGLLPSLLGYLTLSRDGRYG